MVPTPLIICIVAAIIFLVVFEDRPALAVAGTLILLFIGMSFGDFAS